MALGLIIAVASGAFRPKAAVKTEVDQAVLKPSVHTPLIEKVPLGPAPFRGPRDARVTIVEISDLGCAFCARAHAVLGALEAKEPNDVRVTWRSLGASVKREPAIAAEVLLASAKHEKFWALKKQLDQPELDETAIEAATKSLGLDVRTLRTSTTAQAAIEEDRALAAKLRIESGPTFFINGERVDGNAPLPELEAAVKRAKARAGALLALGVAREQLYEQLVKSGRDTAESPRPVRVEEASQPKSAPYAPVRGAPDPKIRIVMFVDFESPYCGKANETMKELLAAYPTQVALELRHAPAQQNLRARPAAKAALAAAAQGQYWRYHDLLLANPKALADTDLLEHAKALKLDLDRFQLDRRLSSSEAILDRDLEEAARLGIRSTPVFYVGQHILRGAQPLDAFKPLIEAAIHR